MEHRLGTHIPLSRYKFSIPPIWSTGQATPRTVCLRPEQPKETVVARLQLDHRLGVPPVVEVATMSIVEILQLARGIPPIGVRRYVKQ